jgi:hypothetical protein
MIENILLIACVLFILYFFYISSKEGFETKSTDSTEKTDNEEKLAALLTNIQEKSDGVQSYAYDHTTQQDNIIIFYGKNNSTAQVSNISGKLQITVDYGSGNKESYVYLQVYDTQILFIDSNNSKNSAVLQKTDKSMTLTVNSNDKEYTFYPNISDNRDSLANYINEYYYTDNASQPEQDQTKTDKTKQTSRDDLYILKSEIVPPVCPVCPTPITINECSKDTKGATGTTGATGAIGATATNPQPSSSFVDTLNSAVKNLEGEFTQNSNSNQNYQNSNVNQNSNQNYQNSNVNQNSMLLPVQNYFANAPALVTSATSDSINEPLPLLNSFSSFG